MVTVVGLVGKAVANSRENIVLNKVDFQQDTTLQDPETANSEPQIQLQGIAANDEAIEKFTQSLQTAFPFGNIVLKSSEQKEFNSKTIYEFSIQCSL